MTNNSCHYQFLCSYTFRFEPNIDAKKCILLAKTNDGSLRGKFAIPSSKLLLKTSRFQATSSCMTLSISKIYHMSGEWTIFLQTKNWNKFNKSMQHELHPKKRSLCTSTQRNSVYIANLTITFKHGRRIISCPIQKSSMRLKDLFTTTIFPCRSGLSCHESVNTPVLISTRDCTNYQA